jgi:hypothetical protein
VAATRHRQPGYSLCGLNNLLFDDLTDGGAVRRIVEEVSGL